MGKQEDVLLGRRISVRGRPGGVYIYIYVYISGRATYSSRAVIRSSALGEIVVTSQHRSVVAATVTRPKYGCGRPRITPRGQGYRPGTARHRHFSRSHQIGTANS